jgi:hypothetical protein
MSRNTYCTLFDKFYLPNFLALFDSLINTNAEGEFFAFCMDDFSYNYLLNYKNISGLKLTPISKKELLYYFPELNVAISNRSKIEFYFTCSSYICKYVIENRKESDFITYLDADLWFFQSPQIIIDEIGNNSIGIIPHNFYGNGLKYLKYGKYNVGLVSFRNNIIGLSCIKDWTQKCLEWCHDYFDEENNRFGDQKYLDNWEFQFDGVHIFKNVGFNLAPWNIGQYKLTKNKSGEILVNNALLVFFHFASFKRISNNIYTTSISQFMYRPNSFIKKELYLKYLIEVKKFARLIEEEDVMIKNRGMVKIDFSIDILRKTVVKLRRWYFNDYIVHK